MPGPPAASANSQGSKDVTDPHNAEVVYTSQVCKWRESHSELKPPAVYKGRPPLLADQHEVFLVLLQTAVLFPQHLRPSLIDST